MENGTAVPYNASVQIVYEPGKDRTNQAKHGVSLAFAVRILADPDRLDVLDVRFDYGEDRIVSYGIVEGRVWVCVFAPRGERHHIISVRRANGRETKRYHDTPR